MSTSRRVDWRAWTPAACPAAYAVTLVVIAVGLSTAHLSPARHQELLERIGSDVAQFDVRRLLAMPLATIVQSSPGIELSMVLLVFVPLLLLEHAIGSLRALITFAFSDWLSTLPNLAGLWALARLGSGEARALLDVADAGSSAAAHGTLAAFFMLLPGRWRPLCLSGLFVYAVGAFWFQRLDAALVHLIACLVGTAFGALWRRSPARRPVGRRALTPVT